MAQKGRVVQSTGSWYLVAIEENGGQQIINCRLPGRFRLKEFEVTNPIAVGDYVEVTLNEDDTGSIQEIVERDNYITRKATHGRQGTQILAANIDRGFVVQSVQKPKFKEGFIDRFLVTCEAYEVEACIVFNKMDLATDKDRENIQHLADLYESLNYTVLMTSIHDEASLQSLQQALEGYTSVMIGPSGVGKTSLLNHIDPEIERPVGEISDYSQKGIHTTTYAKLLPLQFGGYLVDTPGIREFGLVNIEPWELSLFFPEMVEPGNECKFNNCTHSHEPDCGVCKAVDEGQISESRYKSYLQILDSLEENN